MVYGQPDVQLVEVVGRLHRTRFHGRLVDVIPLPHPSGASTWHRVEPGKTLLDQALATIADHEAWRSVVARAPGAAAGTTSARAS